jgi:hypothetical protein
VVGGLVGYFHYEKASAAAPPAGDAVGVQIIDCYSEVDIYCNNEARCGGFIGTVLIETAFYIANCYASGDVIIAESGIAGGFFRTARLGSGSIVDCYASGNVKASASVGGFASEIASVNPTLSVVVVYIIRCYATGDLSVSFGGAGFCSTMINVNVYRCYATGNVSGGNGAIGFINQFSGNVECTVEECFSTGTLTAKTTAAGLFYGAMHVTIKNCYSTCDMHIIDSSNVRIGGLVFNLHGNLYNCYYAGKITGTIKVGTIGAIAGVSISGQIINCHWLRTEDSIAIVAVGLISGGLTDAAAHDGIADMYLLADILNTDEDVWIDIPNGTPQLRFLSA